MNIIFQRFPSLIEGVYHAMRTLTEASLIMNSGIGLGFVLYLFKNHSKLQNYLVLEYFDRHNSFIHMKQSLKISKPWARNEQFIV